MINFIRRLLGLCVHNWEIVSNVKVRDVSFVMHGGEPFDAGRKITHSCPKCKKYKIIRIK